MKTLSMFLVLSTLTIACSGGMPDANGEHDEAPAAATTPQASPEEMEATGNERATFILPPGNVGTPSIGGAGQGGAGGGSGTPASGRRHDQQ